MMNGTLRGDAETVCGLRIEGEEGLHKVASSLLDILPH